MAFPNYFPTGYNPMGNYNPYQAGQYQQMQNTQQAQTGGLQWVQGEAGAKAFPMGAAQSALLMDSENNVFYIKSTDNSGMPLPLRTFDYKERTAQSTPKAAQNAPQTAIDTSLFVTRDELEKRLAELVAKSRSTPNEAKGDVE
jgi:hypothetical protein